MRLIDADKIVSGLHKELELAKINNERGLMSGFRISIRRLNNAPTIDAVPVIRCGDCKWYDSTFYLCPKCGVCVNRDFFCADGERSDDHEPCP